MQVTPCYLGLDVLLCCSCHLACVRCNTSLWLICLLVSHAQACTLQDMMWKRAPAVAADTRLCRPQKGGVTMLDPLFVAGACD